MLILLMTTVLTGGVAQADTVSRDFPLGSIGELRHRHSAVANGLDLHKYRHGRRTWSACVPAGSRKKARVKAKRLNGRARIEEIGRPEMADLPADVTGYRACVGHWPKRKRAVRARKSMHQRSAFVMRAADTGPWRVRVLTIDPGRFSGTLRATVGASVAAAERTSAMAARGGAIAAINGGFYRIRSRKATGSPRGVSIVGGRILREAYGGRTALVMQGNTARVTELDTRIEVTAMDGASAPIDGVNRPMRKGDRLTWFTPEYGRTVRRGEPVMGGDGVIRARGEGREWLSEHPGPYWVTAEVRDARSGRRLAIDADTHVVSGGVAIVRRGKVWINGKANRVTATGMVGGRHPRTMAGVDREGRVILAIVDGRSGSSAGATLPEAARLMRWLGAKDAISLDGGGSTTMVARGRLVNRPSDGRERRVGDAVLVVP